MKKFFILLCVSISMSFIAQGQPTHTVQLDQCHGTLNSPGTWGIPNDLESCRVNPLLWKINIDKVQERCDSLNSTSTTKFGPLWPASWWFWSFPSGYTGGSSSASQFVIVSQPGYYEVHSGGSVLGMQVNFLSDPFVKVDGNPVPGKPHLTDWKVPSANDSIKIFMDSSVGIEINSIFAPPKGINSLWKGNTMINTNNISYQITESGDYTLWVYVNGNDDQKGIKFRVIKNNPHIPVTGVTLNKTSTTLLVGGTETLIATVLPTNATNKAVTWSTSDASKVTVNGGVITGVAVGSATITVTTVDGGYFANCLVQVNPVNIPVTGVTLNKTSTTLLVGGTETLIATVLPTNATNKAVTWSTSDASKVTVNSSGMITGVAVGSATITVTTVDGGYTATCSVQVSSVHVPVTGVTLNYTNWTAKVGDEQLQLIATIIPANATNQNVTWHSTNPSVASVLNGWVTFLSEGSADIIVTTEDGGKTATCHVIVELWVQKYTINASAGPHGSINPSGEITVNQGASQTFTFIPDPNHVIDQVLVDDVPVDSAGSYTFDNVTKDHTIHVTFKYYNSIDEVDPNAVQIYYASGTIYLKNLQPGTMMQVIDLLGRVVYQTIPTGESISFSERGVYVVRVLHRTSQYTKKIVTY